MEVPKTQAGAAADLQAAIKLNSGFIDAHLNQAYIRREQGFPTEAMTLFDAAQKLGGTYPGTELHRISYLAAAGRIDEAMTAVDVALAQPKPHRDLVGTLWQVSTFCSEARRFPEAERLTRLVLQRNPTTFDAWTKLSGDLARQGKFAEAAACARNHLDGNPDAYDGQLALAAWLMHLGQRDEAQALAASARIPTKDAQRIGHYHGIRAIYDAACNDEAAIQHSLTEMLKAPDPQWQRRWYRTDPLFDGYRSKPWFVALIGESPAK